MSQHERNILRAESELDSFFIANHNHFDGHIKPIHLPSNISSIVKAATNN